jgi:hypothetical protein
MIRPRYLLIVVLPILLLGYTNCGQFKSVAELASGLSSSCVAKIRETAKVSFASTVCEDMSAFKCDRRVFKPDANAETKTQRECVKNDSGEEACVDVTTYSFDTEGARDGASPGAFDQGGEYNREEVQCMNSMVLRQNISVVAADASSLQDALSKAVVQCHEKGTR